ncbi:MAG: TonB family protein [Hyphomonas sp.]
MKHLFAAAVFGLFCQADAAAQVAEADILAFNHAVESNDDALLRAAAVRLANAAIANPEDPGAGIAAYEAAWTLGRTGAWAEALPGAKFAAGLPDATAQDRLLLAFVVWKGKPTSANSRSLQRSLDEIQSLAPSGMSASAFREFYASKLNTRDFAGAEKVARQAALHFAAGGDTLRQYEVEARAIAITSRFNTTPRVAQLEEMVHLRGELRQMQRQAGRDRPGWIDDAYWQANAWQNAMQAYFMSVGDRNLRPARLEEILAGYGASDPQLEWVEITEDSLPVNRGPFCAGELVQQPPMRYPAGQAMRGRFGSVIVRFRFENGAVRDPEVLAAVPMDGFRQEALRTVSQWHFRPSEDPAVTGCRLDHHNVIQELVFAIGG